MKLALLLAPIFLFASVCEAAAQRACDRATPFQHNAATGPVEVAVGKPDQRIYLCGYMFAQKGQALDLQIMGGMSSECIVDRIEFSPVFSLPNDFAIVNRLENVGPVLPPGHSLCLQTFGTGSMTGVIYWAQF